VSRYNQDKKTYMGVDTKFYSFGRWLEEEFHDELSRSLRKPSHLYKPINRLRYDKLIRQFKERNIDIKVVQYENILKDPLTVVRKICEWVGVRTPYVTYEKKKQVYERYGAHYR
jgi:hypothetical protein